MTEKLKMEQNPLSVTVEKIKEICPAAVTSEGKIDFEELKTALSDDVAADAIEKYEFTWVGKNTAKAEANRPIRKTLRPVVADSKNWDTTKNLYIEGDNLDALKLLQESYLGKVKMIYIDPPYNTGNDFVYCDEFAAGCEEYLDKKGLCDADGNRLFKNTETNGRFHSDWCSMMYSRLKIARDLLSDDGVIFISIDDHEQANLKKICDEVFGEDNFVTTIHVQLSTTQGMKVKAAQEGNIVKNAEYILCYSKNGHKNVAAVQPLYDLRPEYDEHYSLFLKPDGTIVPLSELYDYRFPKDCSNKKPLMLAEAYKKSDEFADIVRSHLADIVCSDKVTGFDISVGLEQGRWKQVERNEKTYILTLDKNEKIRQLLRLKDSWGKTDGFYGQEGLRKIRGDWWDGFYIDMGNVSKEGDVEFKNGKKPVRLIKQLVKMSCDKDALVIDFFSGSATTAHAVMQLNAEDGGNRRFIMVQLPEKCDEDSEAFKAGYENICEIGKERIRRAGEKIKAENPDKDMDIGFRVLRIDSTNMKDVYYKPSDMTQETLLDSIDNIKNDRTDLDLLFGVMVDCGLPLDMSIETKAIDGKTYYVVNHGDLVACFEQDVPEKLIYEIANMKPQCAVFRDSSFATAKDKVNVTEIFKNITGRDDCVKVL